MCTNLSAAELLCEKPHWVEGLTAEMKDGLAKMDKPKSESREKPAER